MNFLNFNFKKAFILLVIFGILLTAIFTIILIQTGSAAPYLDALIAAFSLIAQGLLAKKKIENWFFWIILNIITVVMFYYMQVWISVGLYLILVVLAMLGYLQWHKIVTSQSDKIT